MTCPEVIPVPDTATVLTGELVEGKRVTDATALGTAEVYAVTAGVNVGERVPWLRVIKARAESAEAARVAVMV